MITSLRSLGDPTCADTAMVSVSVTAVLVASAATLYGDYPAALFIAAVLVMPFVLYALAQGLSWNEPYASLFCIGIIVLQCAVFRQREIEDKSIDAQVVVKLACIALMGIMPAVAVLQKRWSLRELRDVGYWLLFLVYFCLTCLISIDPLTALVEATSNLFALWFLFSIAKVLGARRLVEILLLSFFILCTLSLVAYVAAPQIGRMYDWIDGAYVATSRLQGVFGTANLAGAVSALGLLLLILLSGISWRRPRFYVVAAPFLFCLLASNNRMALGAMVAALAFIYLKRGNAPLKLAVGLLLLSIGILALVNFSDALLGSVARSGSADEITSGTGRTRIWSVVVQLWMQQPIFGYGYGSAKYILPVHPLLFKAAAHAHNLYLNILFSGGGVGLGIFLVASFASARAALRRGTYELVGFLVFFGVYGITEPTIGGTASAVSICFYAVLLLTGYSRRSLQGDDGAVLDSGRWLRRRTAAPCPLPHQTIRPPICEISSGGQA